MFRVSLVQAVLLVLPGPLGRPPGGLSVVVPLVRPPPPRCVVSVGPL